MKPSLIIVVLLVAALLLFSCENEERQPAPAGQALAGAEVADNCEEELPGVAVEPSTAIGFHSHPPYTIFTPNAAWVDHTQGGTPFFVRVEEIGSNNELAYVEVYPLYNLPDVVEQALWLGAEPQAALEEYLTELIREMIPGAMLGEGKAVEIDGYPAARRIYYSEKEDISGIFTRAFNEVTLVLVGKRLHLIEAYCYADHEELLHQELTLLADHLLIEPPPPPIVVLTEEELAALELAEGEATETATEATESLDEVSEIE